MVFDRPVQRKTDWALESDRFSMAGLSWRHARQRRHPREESHIKHPSAQSSHRAYAQRATETMTTPRKNHSQTHAAPRRRLRLLKIHSMYTQNTDFPKPLIAHQQLAQTHQR